MVNRPSLRPSTPQPFKVRVKVIKVAITPQPFKVKVKVIKVAIKTVNVTSKTKNSVKN
jgi:hypothetical protein